MSTHTNLRLADPTGSNEWCIGPISSPRLVWANVSNGRIHQCPYCKIPLLTGERPGFCCGDKGSKLANVPPLPPLPSQYHTFLNHPSISALSRTLNLLFSFASLESTHPFPHFDGPPGFFAVQGRVYHLRWLLIDSLLPEFIPHAELARSIPPAWITSMRVAISCHNPFARALWNLACLPHHICHTASVILEDTGASTEIAAVMTYDNTTQAEVRARRMVIVRLNGNTQNLPTVSRMWEPLAYPLFFPHGTLGWGICNGTTVTDIAHIDPSIPSTQIWHYRARLLRESRFSIFGRLTNEYAVDMYTRDLDSRLQYIRSNQQRLREQDAELMGLSTVEDSENIYLPSSFLGSHRWASEQISDSLAIAAAYGNPTFFITMTCNTQWPEIQSQLRPGQNYTDIGVVVCRVFHRKLALLESTLKTMFPNAGGEIYSIHSVEFQKRGLPHAHILIKYASNCILPLDIDQVVSAEMPQDPTDAALVRQFMLHNHPPLDRPASKYCQREDANGTRKCRFHYPQVLQSTTTIDSEGRVHYRRRKPGDEMVYLFKYIHKGPDRARYQLHDPQQPAPPVDEIEEYWNARYLSAGEAIWRILGFHITKKTPAVTTLPVHLPSSMTHYQYSRRHPTASLSLLQRYFLRPSGAFMHADAQVTFESLKYTDYYSLFRLVKYDVSKEHSPRYFAEKPDTTGAPRMHVVLRTIAHRHLSRMHSARPSEGERFYLRALLRHRPATSFEDIRTIDNVIFDSFQAAATHLGLFASDDEARYAMAEAIDTLRTPRELRILFIHLLMNECIPTPLEFWELFADALSRDFTLQADNSTAAGKNHALGELGHYLEEYGKQLASFGLPQPLASFGHEVHHEVDCWASQLGSLQHRAWNATHQFNADQTEIFDHISSAIDAQRGLCAFVDGKAGRGKTFLIDALCCALRAQSKIVLATATSAFAAQIYDGGRTTHSTFKVPVNANNEMLISPIEPHHGRGELIREASLIIWDEAPMVNRAVLACVDETCRRVMADQRPFGGKVVVLLGDFRQTCPVVPRGTRRQVIDASIKSSPLWPNFEIHRLSVPIRNAEDPQFADFVDHIGDGAGPEIMLPSSMFNITAAVEEVISFVFPPHILAQPTACLRRAILAPTNLQVDSYNTIILDQIIGQERTYLAADSLKESDEVGITTPDSVLDYVAAHTPTGFPAHALRVKVNGVYRLMRNLSIDRGLVKNTRVCSTGVGRKDHNCAPFENGVIRTTHGR
ncbi:ATP-dependent DNA helicase PIF1, partial [Grifola frondosa]